MVCVTLERGRSQVLGNGVADQEVAAAAVGRRLRAGMKKGSDSRLCGRHHERVVPGGAADGQQSTVVNSRADAGGLWRTVTADQARRGPLTWRFSFDCTVLNGAKFHGEWPGTDLARRKPGVQIPSPPPPTLQVRASPASSGRRSLHAAAAARPHAQVAVQPRRLAATRRLGLGLT
jgi:hypothetical protein